MEPLNRFDKRPLRVRIFVDFWNFTLMLGSEKHGFRADWLRLGDLFSSRTAAMVDPDAVPVHEATHVYASFDPSCESGKNMKGWCDNWLSAQRGLHVSCAPRQRKLSAPRCPSCYTHVETCPSCQETMRGTEEKGVDTRIVTDMMSYAWSGGYDVGLLISSDSDFVPVADELMRRGIKIVHGRFGSKGMELSRSCWGVLDLASLMPEFELVR